MNILLHMALANVLCATGLALLALTVGACCRRPALVHGLWLLVLIKLVTPPLFPITLSWGAWAEKNADQASSSEPIRATTANDANDLAPLLDEANEDFALLPGEPPGPTASPLDHPGPAEEEMRSPDAAQDSAGGWPWRTVLLGLWLAGSAWWFLQAGLRLRRFHCDLREAELAPAEVQERTGELAARLGLKCCPGVWVIPGRLSPMLWSVAGRPRLLFPGGFLNQLEERRRDTLLLHELAHAKRKDHWVRLVEGLCLGLYWWFPVAWLASRQLREAEEQCCDAWVVSVLPEAAPDYAHALVDTLDFLAGVSHPAPALASGVGRVSDLRRRLTMIMSGVTPRSMGWTGRLAVLGLGVMLLPFLPMGAQAEGEKEKDKPVVRLSELAVDKRVQRTQEELEKLQKELETRLKEVKEAKARAEAAKRKPRPTPKTEKTVHRTIRVEIDVEGSAKEADAQVARIKEAVSKAGGKGTKVRVIVQESTWRPRFPFPPPRPPISSKPRFRAPFPFPGKPPRFSPAPIPPKAKAEPRMDRLEKRLDEVVRQLESIRRDLDKGPRPAPPFGLPPSRGGFRKPTPPAPPRPPKN
jgi:bla regulator protein BlaR1